MPARRTFLQSLLTVPAISALLPKSAQAETTAKPGEYAYHRFTVKPNFRSPPADSSPVGSDEPEWRREYEAVAKEVARHLADPKFRAIDCSRQFDITVIDRDGREWGHQFGITEQRHHSKPAYNVDPDDEGMFVICEITSRAYEAHHQEMEKIVFGPLPLDERLKHIHRPSPLDRRTIDQITVGFWYVVLA